MATIESQWNDVKVEIMNMLEKNSVPGMNAAAELLRKEADEAAKESSMYTKEVGAAIKVDKTTDPDQPATVYIDTNASWEAGFIHERYSNTKIEPSKSDYLYIPLTSAGKKHRAGAHDGDSLGLKGFIPKQDSKDGRARMIGDTKSTGAPDYVLKKEANVPASRAAGFLTKTAEKIANEITVLIAKLLVPK